MSETHNANCRWRRTTSAECAYRNTHHYCPHPEHACTCPPRTKPYEQHLDERMISANDVLGFLLAAIEEDEADATNDGRQSVVAMLIEIAKRRKEAGTLYSDQPLPSPPERLYVQLTPAGSAISYIHDPRKTRDNGKPIYVYALQG